MIVFRGELSVDCKKNIYHNLIVINLITMSLVSVLLAIPVTFAVVYDDIVWAIAYILIPVLFLGVPISAKNQKLAHPTEITIGKETISIVGESFTQEREIAQIKRIVDHGSFYKIIFNFPNRSVHCLCQKDLLVEGTIEEFEDRFATYIVKSK